MVANYSGCVLGMHVFIWCVKVPRNKTNCTEFVEHSHSVTMTYIPDQVTQVRILCFCVKPWASLFTLQSSRYFAIDKTFVCERYSRINCSLAECFPEKPILFLIEQICQVI